MPAPQSANVRKDFELYAQLVRLKALGVKIGGNTCCIEHPFCAAGDCSVPAGANFFLKENCNAF